MLQSKKTLVASLIALLVSSSIGLTQGSQNPVDNRLAVASSKFAFKLYDQLLKRRSGNNTFVSPASVMLALAMTYNGADGTTRQGMARTLQIEGMSLEEVNRAFADLKSALAPADPKVQLKIANSLWVKNGFVLNPAFVERNKQHYDAEITNLDFLDPSAPKTINSWVNKNTDGKIEKIVDHINDGDVLFLINAIYFKGQWQFEFKKENTKPDVFRLAGGVQKEVQMMSQSGSFLYYKGKDFQSVALPYGSTGRVMMYVFLPDDQKSLDQFEKDLTPENWEIWTRSIRTTPGELMLPRFKVEWEAELNEPLAALGMAEAFDERADFSQMAKLNPGTKLFISEVKHKSFCEVNEEGTVAAAATGVRGSLTSYEPPREKFVMKVDRPFFYAIRDNATGVVLFMGSVTNPG